MRGAALQNRCSNSLWSSGAATHLLSIYLYSFPRGNLLSTALQKQSGENVIFIVQPEVKAHGCSPPAAPYECCWRAVLSPYLLNLRQRNWWAEGICFMSQVTWSLARGTAFLLCQGNDLHFSRSRALKKEKKKKKVQVFGYLMWLTWLWKPEGKKKTTTKLLKAELLSHCICMLITQVFSKTVRPR